MLTITTTTPDGRSITDNRPGHSMEGLAYRLDPFQRKLRIPAQRVSWSLAMFQKSNVR